MSLRYISEVKDGTRRTMRMRNGGARKTDFRRLASTPAKTRQVSWDFPIVWLMGREAGYWETMAVQRLGERAYRASWGVILNSSSEKSRAAGETDERRKAKEAYPAGMPLSATGVKSSRNYRPNSLVGGAFI